VKGGGRKVLFCRVLGRRRGVSLSKAGPPLSKGNRKRGVNSVFPRKRQTSAGGRRKSKFRKSRETAFGLKDYIQFFVANIRSGEKGKTLTRRTWQKKGEVW